MDIAYLRNSIKSHPARPIIHHLNADTSWLLQLPIPSPSSTGQRRYFNILLDPWLSGSQADVASWFSQQWHATPSAYASIADVQDLCATAEAIASSSAEIPTSADGRNYIDAVAISHEFTDHCHRQTLEEVDRSVPVFAWAKAAKLIGGWKWFDRVVEIPAFTKDWRDTSIDPLPEWLGIGRLFNESDGLYYHAALTITFTLSPSSPAEVVIYSPHGLHAPTLTPIPLASPPVTPLCLLHGLHDIYLDWRQQLNLGAHHALAAQRMLGAKYWMGTHDEEKKGTGVVSWFLRRKKYSVQEAVEREMKTAEEETEKAGVVDESEWEEKAVKWRGTGWREVGNGTAVVLREDGQ